LAAIFYDALICLALFFAATFALLVFTEGQAVPAGNPFYILYLALVAWVYFAASWLRGGQTVGLRAFRLACVDAQGGPVRRGQTVIRFLAAGLAFLSCGLGYLWSLWDPERRAWPDIASGTRIRHLP
jgi:uncharacterized RDD family membrane protein YckC